MASDDPIAIARLAERAAIVRWLLGQAGLDHATAARVADAIDDGAHLVLPRGRTRSERRDHPDTVTEEP